MQPSIKLAYVGYQRLRANTTTNVCVHSTNFVPKLNGVGHGERKRAREREREKDKEKKRG